MLKFRHKSLSLKCLFLGSFLILSLRVLSLDCFAIVQKKSALIIAGIQINHRENTPTQVLRQPNGEIWVTSEVLHSWRIRAPFESAPLAFEGNNYYSLNAIRDLTYEFNSDRQELTIQAQPKSFLLTHTEGTARTFYSPTHPQPGLFFNYDFLATRSSQDISQTPRLDGTVELGLFTAAGVGTSTALARNLTTQAQAVRLESTWTYDRPEKLSSYRFGDSINKSGNWGRPTRYGGIQWATNFATQPGYITFPLYALRGEATLPSTVDIYVNNNLRTRQEVPTGPFEIVNVPMVTGQGEIQLVVRDYLGRETLITQPYYVSSSLLKKGLHDFSYEIGSLRQNFALESNSYGPTFASLTHRLGVSDFLTGEIHTEILNDFQNIGVTPTLLVPDLGTLSTSLAFSRKSSGEVGELITASLNRLTRRYGFGFRSELASQNFSQIGNIELNTSRVTHAAYFGISPRGSDSLSLNYLNQQTGNQTDLQIASLNYSFNFLSKTLGSIYTTRTLNHPSDFSVGINLSRSLGERTSGYLSSARQNKSNLNTAQLQQNLPVGPGVGYRLITQQGSENRAEASGFLQTDFGNYTAEVSHLQNSVNLTEYRLGAAGAFSFLGNSAFASRKLTDSFGVVKVDHFPNVTVYAEHQAIGKTRSDGSLLIPRLRPYDINRLGIEQSDLPIDALVDQVEMEVVPYYRAGVVAQFSVRSSRGALIRILLPDGSEMPAGAVVRIQGKAEEFWVANHGQAFVTGLEAHNSLDVEWNNQTCTIEVDVPSCPLPSLGPYLCREIKP